MTIDSADDLSSCIIQRLHIPLLSGSIAGELNFIDDLCEARDGPLIEPTRAQDLRDSPKVHVGPLRRRHHAYPP